MQTTANEAVTLHSAALPDLVCTAITSIAPDQPIAVLPLGHPWLSSSPQLELLDSALMPRLYQPAPTCLIPSVQLFNPSVLTS